MIKRFTVLIAGVAALTCCGPLRAAATIDNGPAATNSVMDSLDNQYKLGPGDQVLFQVVEDQDSPTNLTVTDSGDLEVPYYGLVHAADKTCRQLASGIKTLLEKKLYYQATVVVALEVVNKAWVMGKVYVTGQVRNPGGYELRAGGNMTVSKAILDAGGFSDFSDKKHVRLIRKGVKGDQSLVVNVLDVWKGQLDKDLTVQPGDLVVVPARLINY
jgi:polysaccharide export outer membrane protein